MRFSKLFFAFLLIVLGLSCSNDDDHNTTENTVRSLTFGFYSGFCLDKCFNVYKISNQKLEEDTVVNFFSHDYEFDSSFIYKEEVYQKHKSILQAIPNELINGKDKTFGCPDCVDQGAFYVVVETKENHVKKYNIDTDSTEDQSTDILTFKKAIQTIIEDLKPN